MAKRTSRTPPKRQSKSCTAELCECHEEMLFKDFMVMMHSLQPPKELSEKHYDDAKIIFSQGRAGKVDGIEVWWHEPETDQELSARTTQQETAERQMYESLKKKYEGVPVPSVSLIGGELKQVKLNRGKKS